MKKLFIFFVILIATVFNTNALENPTANQAIIKIADTLVHLPRQEIIPHLGGAGFNISPNGRKVADIKFDAIDIFDTLNNQKVVIQKPDDRPVNSQSFSHDGTAFIMVLRDYDNRPVADSDPRVYDTTTGKLKFVLKTENIVPEEDHFVFFSQPDEQHIASYTNNCLYLWNTRTGKLLKRNTTLNNLVNNFNGNNKRYLIDVQNANAEENSMVIDIIDALTLQKINQLSVPTTTDFMLLNHDASRLLLINRHSAQDEWYSTMELIDTASKKTLFSKTAQNIQGASFSNDETKILAVVNITIKIFDSNTGNTLQTVFIDTSVYPPTLSPNGKLLLVEHIQGPMGLYSIDTGRLLYTFPTMYGDYFTADSKHLFVRAGELFKVLYKVDLSSLGLYPQRDLESIQRVVAYFNPQRSVETKSLLIKIDELAHQKAGATITKEDLGAEFLKTAQEIPYEVQNALINVYNIDKAVFREHNLQIASKFQSAQARAQQDAYLTGYNFYMTGLGKTKPLTLEEYKAYIQQPVSQVPQREKLFARKVKIAEEE